MKPRHHFRSGAQRRLLALGALCTLLLVPLTGQAQALHQAVEDLLRDHARVAAAQAAYEAAHERVWQTRGGLFPQLDIVSNYGQERRLQRSVSEGTDLEFFETDFKITQMLFDFGKVWFAVDTAKGQRDAARATLEATRHALALEAVASYLNLKRATDVLEYAKQSVANIQRQSAMESAMVGAGRGYATDVLQAKSQLAGAEARETQALGLYYTTRNKARTIFLRHPDEVAKLTPPKVPFGRLPKTVEAAVNQAFSGNQQLEAMRLQKAATEAQLKQTRAAQLLPTINAVFDHKMKDDVAGVEHFEDETIAKVELTYSLNLGGGGIRASRAAKYDLVAADRRLEDVRLQVEEMVRNAWRNLEISRKNAEFLRNQAKLAEQFLELARKERQLGKRSLIDVLAGETALINAQSDATSAEADVKIAAYTLLATMGMLNAETVNDIR